MQAVPLFISDARPHSSLRRRGFAGLREERADLGWEAAPAGPRWPMRIYSLSFTLLPAKVPLPTGMQLTTPPSRTHTHGRNSSPEGAPGPGGGPGCWGRGTLRPGSGMRKAEVVLFPSEESAHLEAFVKGRRPTRPPQGAAGTPQAELLRGGIALERSLLPRPGARGGVRARGASPL